MRRVLFLFMLFAFSEYVFAQDEEIGTVVYVDSLSTNTRSNARQHQVFRNENSSQFASLSSRLGCFQVDYTDNFFMTEGVKRCLRMALDAWEEKLNISVPVRFIVTASENLAPELEIKTTVSYVRNGMTALPISLYAQQHGNGMTDCCGTIDINALIDWNTAWDNDGGSWGTDNLQTALLRHIAHILGFGTSVMGNAEGLGFAIKHTASPFDNLVSNGQISLGSLALRENPTQINDFLTSDIYIGAQEKNYKLFSSPDGYVPYRSGNYFSLSESNVMNYPYGDRSQLYPINDETLDVFSAIGWDVKPYGLHICGTDIDALGYGSLYKSHTFRAEDVLGQSVDAGWTYQIYDNGTHTYIDRAHGMGLSFTVTPADEGEGFMDPFMCLQGRIVCNVNIDGVNKQYTFPLTLEARPYFIGYEIQNVAETPNTDYFSFDIKVSSLGGESGDIIVSSDYGSLGTYILNGSNEQIIHVSQALKIGPTYLYLTLANKYGTSVRFIMIDSYQSLIDGEPGSSTSISVIPVETQGNGFDVYTLQGVRLRDVNGLSNLGKGTYIIKDRRRPNHKGKVIIK